MIIHIDWKKLITSILLPLAVGGASAFITRNDMQIYETLNTPPLSPPGILFPIVWSILYILMGISLYIIRVSKAPKHQKKTAYILFFTQLFFNFIWSPIFFSMRQFLFAFCVLLALWLTIILMIAAFSKISKTAAVLQVPYLLWVTFAGYLNLGIYILNR